MQIDALNPFILVDRSKEIWHCITTGGRNDKTIDFILDNAGYELFTDFVLANFLLDNQLASKIRFHVKAIPWFISDVNVFDFHWTIKTMAEDEDVHLSSFGRKLDAYNKSGQIQLIENEYFWTGPYEFYRMKEIDSGLYDDLSSSDLLIFKGDLNYRKLLGDFNWPFDSTFETVLRGILYVENSKIVSLKICEFLAAFRFSTNEFMFTENGKSRHCVRGRHQFDE